MQHPTVDFTSGSNHVPPLIPAFRRFLRLGRRYHLYPRVCASILDTLRDLTQKL